MTSVLSTLFFGWIVVIAGVIGRVQAIRHRDNGHLFLPAGLASLQERSCDNSRREAILHLSSHSPPPRATSTAVRPGDWNVPSSRYVSWTGLIGLRTSA